MYLNIEFATAGAENGTNPILMIFEFLSCGGSC
jgi:hypothetical protein